ncbi:MAG: hypothetical protein PHU03_08225 [Syntrophales bacterium]|nr:hypothetical protein [Syntrophales bacterium]
MDAKFLEFWGKSLLNLAKGQRQLEELSRFMSGGFEGSGSQGIAELFKSTYGLDKLEKNGAEYLKLYEKASRSFQKSLREYMGLFDVVPRGEMESLQQECEVLKAKVAEQEKVIEQLGSILGEKGMEPGESVLNLQELLKRQTDEFQKMMNEMGKAFQQKRASKSKKK